MSSSLAFPDRARSNSHAGSRLAQCPLCSKFAHVALIEAHAAQCSGDATAVSYTHLTLPTTPYV